MKGVYFTCLLVVSLINPISSFASEVIIAESISEAKDCRSTFSPENGELYLPCVDILNSNGQVESYRVVLKTQSQNPSTFQVYSYEQSRFGQSQLRAGKAQVVKWLYVKGKWVLSNVLWDGIKWVIVEWWNGKSWAPVRGGNGCILTGAGSTVGNTCKLY
jgi:hypothetical protein